MLDTPVNSIRVLAGESERQKGRCNESHLEADRTFEVVISGEGDLAGRILAALKKAAAIISPPTRSGTVPFYPSLLAQQALTPERVFPFQFSEAVKN